MLRCIGPVEVQKLMEKIHEGVCSNHSGGRSLAHKALTAGYFWPYMMAEAARFIKKCDKCQRFVPTNCQPAEVLHSNITLWPFAKWGLDIVGELPRSPGGRRYVLLATDYFTKWVEAEAYAT
ncbi:Ribonuclease H-like domain containing protein, partial [Parasponia andersonii]